MAISVLGAVSVTASGTSSTTITVPANTDAIAIFSTYWTSGGGAYTSIGVDAIDATIRLNVVVSGSANGHFIGTIQPYTGSTGSVTLDWVVPTATEGAAIVVVFGSGCGAYNDHDGSAWTSNASTTATVNSNTTDMVVGIGETYPGGSYSGGPATTDTIISSLDDIAHNSNLIDAVSVASPGASTTGITSGGYYGTVLAVSFLEAAASGGITNTNMVGSQGRLAGIGGGLAG